VGGPLSEGNSLVKWPQRAAVALADRRMFFFEKKNQKTFVNLASSPEAALRFPKQIKVFWFFFSKKNILLRNLRSWLVKPAAKPR
jgi:hypothetical protein